MAKVRLDFVPPQEPDIVKLHIHESDTQTGTFLEIEATTVIGTFPDYITFYTTIFATLINNWFKIQWEDSLGALGDLSQAVQGGTETVVNEIVTRIRLRDSSLRERVITQEVESALFSVYESDPYELDLATINFKQLRGLTNLSMAKTYLTLIYRTGRSQQYVTGLVSEKTASGDDLIKLVGRLLKDASSDLGIGGSTIAQMVDLPVADAAITSSDQSRLLITIT